MDGALILDKPAGMTSHDVVLTARRVLGEKRIGHLGTLDPFATGVLVLLAGQATRLARYYGSRDKTYRGIIRFGFSTDTMDGTGRPLGEDRPPALNEDEMRLAFSEFVGRSLQRPPVFSAKKVGGVPSYRLARKGQAVELKPVEVTVHAFELLWVQGARAGFTARVSSGTYIRSLVHDLGERTGWGAHLEELRRTALGEFGESDALPLKQLEAQWSKGTPPLIPPQLVPISQLLPEMAAITLDEGATAKVVNGRDLELDTTTERVRLFGVEGSLVAVSERMSGRWFHPVVVLGSVDKDPAALPQDRSASSRAAGSL